MQQWGVLGTGATCRAGDNPLPHALHPQYQFLEAGGFEPHRPHPGVPESCNLCILLMRRWQSRSLRPGSEPGLLLWLLSSNPGSFLPSWRAALQQSAEGGEGGSQRGSWGVGRPQGRSGWLGLRATATPGSVVLR